MAPFAHDENIRRFHWAGYVIPAVLVVSSIAAAMRYPSWLWVVPVVCSLGAAFATFRIRSRDTYGQVLAWAIAAGALIVLAIVAVGVAMKSTMS
ncbi:hypothetical protein JNUCC0626_31295 [Lentzea sp. JNUCC 0626]|uniref:hypothetical protein n=1 Tax=Lentzea sp. JNUCC 0626 TaxID=3367513 RepID=UPI0037478487